MSEPCSIEVDREYHRQLKVLAAQAGVQLKTLTRFMVGGFLDRVERGKELTEVTKDGYIKLTKTK